MPFDGKSLSGDVVVHARIAGAHGARPETLLVSNESGKVTVLDLTSKAPETLELLKRRTMIGYDVKRVLKMFIALVLNHRA